jgi:hypothetical protein
MVALVSAETVVLALLTLLVAGLLRSHADILHRLAAGEGQATGPIQETEPGVALPRENATPAHDVAGTGLDGSSVVIGVVGAPTRTILAFLSSGCLTCGEFWKAFADERSLGLPHGTRVVVVTKDADEESVSKLRKLEPPAIPVVLSSETWRQYDIPVAPYFIYVDGKEGVVGEGAASTWEQVASLLLQATEDVEFAREHAAPKKRRRRRKERRPTAVDSQEVRADAELLAAGIHPGHPSLYPDTIAPEESGS